MAMLLDSWHTTHAAYTPKRRYPRIPFSVPIMLHHLGKNGLHTTRGITLEIAEGGLGALVQGDLDIGETVAIDLPLSDHPVSLVAIVRYTTTRNTGFEFVGLTADERQQITNVMS